MAAVGGSVVGSPTVTISTPTTRTRYYVDAPVSGTEVSQVLTEGANKLLIYVETLDANCSFSFTTAQSATTADGTLIPRTCAYNLDAVEITGTTLYLQTDGTSKKIIVEEWS